MGLLSWPFFIQQGVLLDISAEARHARLLRMVTMPTPVRLLPDQVRLTAARAKAEAVVGQEDLTERGKAKEIEKLYARARAGKGAPGGKKGKPSRSQQRHGKAGKPLDGRLLADKRQVSAAALTALVTLSSVVLWCCRGLSKASRLCNKCC